MLTIKKNDLNTSHVKVNHLEDNFDMEYITNLNTSHVKVNQNF